ncbi:hypothetical protein Tco_0778308 [Tanacetum coccineum]
MKLDDEKPLSFATLEVVQTILSFSKGASTKEDLQLASSPRTKSMRIQLVVRGGSAEDSMQLKALMDIVPKLVTRIETLETELQQTKTTYGKAVLTLVKRVKILEKALKRKTQRVVISESEGEEPEDQGRIIQDIDDDPLVSLVKESMKMKEKSTDFVTPTKASGEAQEEDISPTILEAAKTLSKVASQGVSKVKSTDKGKRYRRRARSVAKNINTGLDAEEEINTGREEIHTGIEDVSTGSTKVDSGTASKRGQREGKCTTQMDEEVAKQIHLDEMVAKRMAEEEALSEQQKKRKAQIEANAELTKDVLGKDLPEQDFAKRIVDMVNQRKKYFAEERAKAKRNKHMTQSQLRIYMLNYLKNQGTWKLSQLKKLSKKNRKKKKQKYRKGISVDKNAQGDSETDKEESVEAMNPTPLATKSNSVKYETNRPEDAYDRVLWSDLRTMFDPPLNEECVFGELTHFNKRYRKYFVKDACQVTAKDEASRVEQMANLCYKHLKMIEKQAGIRK